jgi:hypothetical protein
MLIGSQFAVFCRPQAICIGRDSLRQTHAEEGLGRRELLVGGLFNIVHSQLNIGLDGAAIKETFTIAILTYRVTLISGQFKIFHSFTLINFKADTAEKTEPVTQLCF